MADNQDAVVTLSASIGEWAHQASQIATAGNSDNSGEQFKGIQNRYQQSAAALSFLAGMADDKAGWKTGQTRGTVKALSDNNKLAFNVFSTVASAGLGVVGGPLGSAAGKTAMFVGATLSRSNINLDFGSNIIDDERDKSDPSDDQVKTSFQQVVHWAEGAYERTSDDRLRELINAVALGKADRYADGATMERTPVPPGLAVCEVVTASQVGEVLHQDIIRYVDSNKIMAPKDASPTPKYTM